MVDPFGNNVLSVTNIPGDHNRIRHDKVKTALNSLCHTSGLHAECEVFGLFKDLIPVEAMNQENSIQRGRGRQGLLPDFMLEMPTPEGLPANSLAELKVIGAVKSWYSRSGVLAWNRNGVERRAVELPGEYKKPLAKLDAKYHGTLPNQTGPLGRRLEVYGRLVVGAWQEGSKDLHTLLDILADTKVRKPGLARGVLGTDTEKAIHLSQFRRKVSLVAGKAQSYWQSSKVGESFRQAAKRRKWIEREEERMKEERRTFWHANVCELYQ